MWTFIGIWNFLSLILLSFQKRHCKFYSNINLHCHSINNYGMICFITHQVSLSPLYISLTKSFKPESSLSNFKSNLTESKLESLSFLQIEARVANDWVPQNDFELQLKPQSFILANIIQNDFKDYILKSLKLRQQKAVYKLIDPYVSLSTQV